MKTQFILATGGASLSAAKGVLSILVILATACPLRADTILLRENFEGVVGKSVNGWNGWKGDPGIVISDVVIDDGNSATWTGNVEWPAVSRSFQHTPAPGDEYILTATLSAPDSGGAYADLRFATGDGGKAKHAGAQLGYRDLYFQQDNATSGTVIRITQTAMTMDVRLVVSDDHIDCFYRNHGEPSWTSGGRLKAANRMVSYNTVTVVGGVVPGRSVGGGADNIQLAVRQGGPQPGPASQPK
jgi:hypothetical protein